MQSFNMRVHVRSHRDAPGREPIDTVAWLQQKGVRKSEAKRFVEKCASVVVVGMNSQAEIDDSPDVAHHPTLHIHLSCSSNLQNIHLYM